MNTVVKMQFGSHVYGTNVPDSDHDYKQIIIPPARDILLQKAEKSIHKTTKKDPDAKNTKDDEDLEIFTLQKWIKLLLEGQTGPLDMLFVPDKFIIEKSDYWTEIQYHKDKFIHKGVHAFAGYCRQQANKYGIKGSRMGAVKWAKDYLYLKHHNLYYLGNEPRLEGVNLDQMIKLSPHGDLIKMVDCKAPNNKIEPHLEVCTRKFGMRTKLEYVINTLQKIYDGYGERARKAEQNKGVDWKALMHAVRVQREAEELLTTGHITFPRPEKELLLKIRKGEMSYKEVAAIIEEGLEELEETAKKSTLPEKPDYEFAEELVFQAYEEACRTAGCVTA